MTKHRSAPIGLLHIFAFIFLLACVSATAEEEAKRISYGKLLADNQTNILRISPGLSKEQLLEIMGESRSKVKSTPITNPYKRDVFAKDKDEYEVLFYLTRRYPPYTAVRESQATPIVIKNGKVVGVGVEALKQLRDGGK